MAVELIALDLDGSVLHEEYYNKVCGETGYYRKKDENDNAPFMLRMEEDGKKLFAEQKAGPSIDSAKVPNWFELVAKQHAQLAVECNRELLTWIEKLKANSEKAVLILNTNRQGVDQDAFNAFKQFKYEGSGTLCFAGSCRPTVKAISEAAGIELDNMLMADLVHDNALEGMTAEEIDMNLANNSYPDMSYEANYPYSDYFDDSKLSTALAHMHKYASKYPGEPINYRFLDDSDHTILRPLHKFFTKNREFIPDNVTVYFYPYQGSFKTMEENESYPPIKGTGSACKDYRKLVNSIYEVRGEFQTPLVNLADEIVTNSDIKELLGIKPDASNAVSSEQASEAEAHGSDSEQISVDQPSTDHSDHELTSFNLGFYPDNDLSWLEQELTATFNENIGQTTSDTGEKESDDQASYSRKLPRPPSLTLSSSPAFLQGSEEEFEKNIGFPANPNKGAVRNVMNNDDIGDYVHEKGAPFRSGATNLTRTTMFTLDHPLEKTKENEKGEEDEEVFVAPSQTPPAQSGNLSKDLLCQYKNFRHLQGHTHHWYIPFGQYNQKEKMDAAQHLIDACDGKGMISDKDRGALLNGTLRQTVADTLHVENPTDQVLNDFFDELNRQAAVNSLITILQSYKDERNVIPTEKYFFGHFFGGGFTKTEKTAAVDNLIAILKGEKNPADVDVEDYDAMIKPLNQGSLGKRIQDFIDEYHQFLPVRDDNRASIKNISDLVNRVAYTKPIGIAL